MHILDIVWKMDDIPATCAHAMRSPFVRFEGMSITSRDGAAIDACRSSTDTSARACIGMHLEMRTEMV